MNDLATKPSPWVQTVVRMVKRTKLIRTQPGILSISLTAWKKGVRSGKYPAPVKLPGARLVRWRKRDICALVGVDPGDDGDSLLTSEQITGRRVKTYMANDAVQETAIPSFRIVERIDGFFNRDTVSIGVARSLGSRPEDLTELPEGEAPYKYRAVVGSPGYRPPPF